MTAQNPLSPLAAQLLTIAVGAANSAADLLLARQDKEYSIRFKSHGEIVTDVDIEAERLIRRCILSERPHDSILGEEEAPVQGKTGITWLIDPIDGTTNYLRKLPGYTVSIAARSERITLAAAVCDPVHHKLYTASCARGAFCNNRRVSVSQADDLSTSLIGTGLSVEMDVRPLQAARLAELLQQIGDVRCSGGCAYDLCQVASGHLDGYYEAYVKPWDYAAGILIAKEAGAEVREQRLDDSMNGFIVAAAPGIAGQLKKYVGM
jgi:myo-inositol-1(or 4)-monophosphatase